jgi:hypothetical protein
MSSTVLWLSRLTLVGGLLLLSLLTLQIGDPLEQPAPDGDRLPPDVEVLNGEETVELFTEEREEGIEASAVVDTGAHFSSIDTGLARDLGIDLENANRVIIESALGSQLRPIVDVRMRIAGRTLDARVTVADRSGLSTPVLVGRSDLDGFVVRVESDQETSQRAPESRSPILAALEGPSQQPGSLTLLVALPLVAVLVLTVRTLAGLKTFGLFVPVLLSLAFVQAGLPAGLAVVGITLAVGVIGGVLLGLLQVRHTARLAMLLVVAANILLALNLFTDSTIPENLAAVSSLIAGALVVERFWNALEREGWPGATEAACWTLLASVLASFLLTIEPVLVAIQDFPLLLGSLGALISVLIGIYWGSSLTESANSPSQRKQDR